MKKFFCIILFSLSLCLAFAEKIFFSADSMSGQAGNSSSTTILEGEAFVQTDTMKIQADKIELSGENYRVIIATGNVSGQNLETEMEFTCNQLSFDRSTKIAALQGDVSLIDKENDVTASAQIIEYNQATDTAIMQIKINLKQKNNECSGSYAIYLKKQQLLELSGNAQIKQDDDTFRAQHISLNMETQEITLDGNVRGSVKESKEKEAKPVEEKPEVKKSGKQNKSTAMESTDE